MGKNHCALVLLIDHSSSYLFNLRKVELPVGDFAATTVPHCMNIGVGSALEIYFYGFFLSLFPLTFPLTSYLLPLTSYLLPLTSYLLPLTSYLLPLTSYLLPLTSYLLPLTFYLLPLPPSLPPSLPPFLSFCLSYSLPLLQAALALCFKLLDMIKVNTRDSM